MFTHCLKRLKISVVFTLEFHANCIHKMSFKSFTTSKTSHCPISQSVSNLLHFKLFLLHLGVEGTHLNTMWQDFPLRKPFVPGRGHSESAGGAPSCFCLVLLVFFLNCADSFATMRRRLSFCYLLEANASWAVIEYPHN